MSPTIGELLERLQSAEDALEEAFDARRREMAFILKGRKAVFDEKVAALHRAFRTGIFAYVRGALLSVILSAPAILAVAVPLLLLDLFVIVYQAVCFPVYGLKKVPRSDFIVFDRAELAYLNILVQLPSRRLHLAGAVEAAADPSAARELNVFFNWNGHTWEAFEVLGVPAGSQREVVVAAFHAARAKSPDATPFFQAATDAILKRN